MVTFVPPHVGAIPKQPGKAHTCWQMTPMPKTQKQRSGSRTKAVLPVRIKGTDSSGAPFEELAHTLDVTPSGLRLGAVRRELNLHDEVTVFYLQRKGQSSCWRRLALWLPAYSWGGSPLYRDVLCPCCHDLVWLSGQSVPWWQACQRPVW